MATTIETSKTELIKSLKQRVEDGIIEQANADLIIKMIEKADSLTEAINIAELGTTYKRTGFHFDKRLEKMGDTIKYLKKNDELSFSDGSDAMRHKLIIGDNYDALQNLLISYRGKIDVIYIDPPYGKDDMGEFAFTNYDNAITRDNLLSMLYPRLLLARKLMSERAVIFCSIDDRNMTYVSALFDEVFGERNKVGTLVWEKKKKPAFLAEFLANIKEYVLVYCKSAAQFNGLIGEINYETETYPCINASNARDVRTIKKGIKSNYREKTYTIPAGTTISDNTMNIVYLTDLVVKDGVVQKDFKVEGNWRYSQDLMTQYSEDKELYITQSLYIRRIVSDPREKAMKDLLPRIGSNPDLAYNDPISSDNLFESGWGSNEDADNEMISILGEQGIFSYPKPTRLITKLLLSTGMKDAIVLDFFAGSGTAGQSALQANIVDGGNRQFIVCTNNERSEKNPNGIALDVTTRRLKRVMTGTCYDGSSDFSWAEENDPLGGSLDVYDIESVANFEQGEGKSPFAIIDETAYGIPRFEKQGDKVKWICENFDNTQKYLED